MNVFMNPRSGQESDWIGISDLMAGLMMIFLFVAICYMNSLQARERQIREIAMAYQQLQNELFYDLYSEFRNDLAGWKAEIDRETLSVTFHEPEVLFEQGSSTVSNRFQDILMDFFPRYLRIMRSEKYRDRIEEIRIEGHTSSEWETDDDEENAYILNMELSQDRTRSVLKICLDLIEDRKVRRWAQHLITANGLSSSRLVMTDEGMEDKEQSRRVEFRTKTASEKKIYEIIQKIKSS